MSTRTESSEFPFKRILVTIDGSVYSLSAARVAIELAKKHGADLVVLNVLYTPVCWVSYSPVAVPPLSATELRKREEKEAHQLVEKVKLMAREHGTVARGEVLDGIPSTVQAITEFAANEKIDLIVVGTRGLSGFKKLLIGSVSSGVVTHAPCSVLVVR